MKEKAVATVVALVMGCLAVLVFAEFAWLASGFLREKRVVAGRGAVEESVNGLYWNRPLGGVTGARASIPLSGAALASHAYQGGLEHVLGDDILGRGFLIRLKNEVYFRLFDVAITNFGIVLGKGNSIYGSNFLSEYCLDRNGPGKIDDLVARLDRFQARCRRDGKGFCLVVTPSKASVCPESIPGEWLRKFDPRPRFIDQFRDAADKSGLTFVDGPRFSQELKARTRFPLFPRGGIHWGWFLSNRTTDQVIGTLWGPGPGAPFLVERSARVDHNPIGEDCDMVNLLNALSRWRYAVYASDIVPLPHSPWGGKRVAIVGGSFCNKMYEALGQARIFSSLEFYFYYHRFCVVYAAGKSQKLDGLPDAAHIYGNDVIILELNEEALGAPQHILAFLDDLAAQPAAESVPKGR